MIKSSHNHPFHMVTISPWPLMTSLCLFNCAIGLIKFFHANNMNLILLSIFSTILMLSQWWRDIIRESTFQGNHTKYIQSMLKFSMVMFIMSELMFFVSFFWTYFHMALSPSIEIGSMWPPMGIVIFNPYSIPLLNTIILVSSGISITWCHYSIINNKFKESLISLILTCFLGLFFTFFQVLEYYEAPFTINDSVYGSIFFVTTGFHGLHVIIGTIFLTICLLRLFKMHFSSKRHFGFEAAAWYWHFVDVIWLFLYICMYWWIF